MDCNWQARYGRGHHSESSSAGEFGFASISSANRNLPLIGAPAESGLAYQPAQSSDIAAAAANPYTGLLEQNQAPDTPLDAFDKELLATESAEDRSWQASQGLARLSLPPKPLFRPRKPSSMRQGIRGDLHATPRQRTAASSSPSQNSSSPTVVALKQRHDRGPHLISQSPMDRAPSSPPPQNDVAAVSEPAQVRDRKSGPASKIQLSHAPPVVQGIPLVSVNDLPDRLRSLFPFQLFNAVQSRCFATAFGTDENLVISAPTGSGKTAIMELAICRLMHTVRGGDFKIVYQAPTKALCAERCVDWQSKFGPLDLHCAELTGDTDANQMRHVQAANIIITTPEKWDSITRRWKDHIKLMRLVKLFLIDEVHILKESRGATLEVVVSRMKSTGSSVRFVALSATIPNSEDVAQWLGKDPITAGVPAHREVFGEEFRPVQLQKFTYGYSGKSNDFIFDNVIETKLPEIIAKYSQRKPVMIFCPYRKSCVKTAKYLARLWTSTMPHDRLWSGSARPPGVKNSELRQFVPAGVAFHHAGLELSDRRAIEQGFRSRNISIICCTSTLAVGVNLPCYLVIIKGTKSWTDNGSQEYADLEMMQMLGRAGRPDFEQSACAVILTRNERVDYYERLVSGQEPLESCLHLNLIDHLNAEIGLGTVSDLHSARRWLASTFLFVRLSRNMNHYRLEEDVVNEKDSDLLEQICSKDVTLLQQTGLVSSGLKLSSTEFGDAMARYYVKFDTMKMLLSLPPKAKLSEIISNIVQAAEFRDLRLKSGEKAVYKHINKDIRIKFPIKVDIALSAHKISLLLQAELGGLEFPVGDQFAKHKPQFQQDKATVFQHVNRLIRCVIDCQLIREDSGSARHALELARSFAARVWDTSPLQLKQLDQIGNVAVRKLANAGINSIESLENTEADRIENVIGRGPPFGMKLLSQLAQFPKLRVLVKMAGKETMLLDCVKIRLNAEIGFLNEIVPTFFRRRPIYVCFLAETSDGRVIDFRRIPASKLQHGHEMLLSAELTKFSQYVICHAMCDEIAGTCRSAELRPDIPASLFPAPTKQQGHEQNTGSSEKNFGSGQAQNANRKRKRSEDFDDDGLNDGDMLAAENVGVMDVEAFESALASLPPRTEGPSRKTVGKAKKLQVNEDGGEPVRLENGKWACNHKCKDKTNCKHMCCRDGLDKAPKSCRKPTSGRTGDHLSVSSMLELINDNPSRIAAASKKSSSDREVQKKGHSLREAGEARNSNKLQGATVPITRSKAVNPAGVRSQIGASAQQSPLGTRTVSKKSHSTNFEHDAFDGDWANEMDFEDLDDLVNPQDSFAKNHQAFVATNVDDNVDRNNDLPDIGDDDCSFDDNDASMIEASLVGLEDSLRLNRDSTSREHKKNDPASLSSGTVRASSSSRGEPSDEQDSYDFEAGFDTVGRGDPDAPPPFRHRLPNARADEHAHHPFNGDEPATSPFQKIFFTPPARGQATLPSSSPGGTTWQQKLEAGIASPITNIHVPLEKLSNAMADDRVPCKAESRTGKESEGGKRESATCTHSEGAKEQALWRDGIDPSFFDEFKKFVDFI